MHNAYAIKHKIKGGKILKITNLYGWYGSFSAERGCVYDKSKNSEWGKAWKPQYKRSLQMQIPTDNLLNFDQKFHTHYAFLSDGDFKDEVWRDIMKKDMKLAENLEIYFWHKYSFQNQVSNSIGLNRLNCAGDVGVK